MRIFAITLFGKDKVGILYEVTKCLFEIGGNIHDSSSCVLDGYFSISMVFSIENCNEQYIEDVITGKLGQEYYIKVFELNHIGELNKLYKGKMYTITLIGQDSPGIVYKLTNILLKKKINIVKFRTKTINDTNKRKFMTMAEVIVPTGIDIKKIYKEIESFEDEYALNIVISELKDD